jgi:hypothetical protein
MSNTPKKGWLRFSIRDLLWLTILAAVIMAWALDHWNLSETIKMYRKPAPAGYQ